MKKMSRLNRLKKALKEKNLDAALLMKRENLCI